MAQRFDLVVIGSGPGGYVAAARASSLGLKTAIIERDPALGGTCLHRGCIPTKALLHAADVYTEVKEGSDIGILASGVKVDYTQVQKYKAGIVKSNAGGVSHLMKAKKIEVFQGFGSLKSATQVSVKDESGKETLLDTQFIMLAVGSTPRELPFAPFKEARILSSDHVLDLDKIPKSITIVGGGVIGIEFASLFSSFGSKVTVVEALPEILMGADPQAKKELQTQLEKRDVDFFTGVKVTKVTSNSKSSEVSYEGDKSAKVKSDYTLIAIGRGPLTTGIGLEEAGVELDRGFIKVNGMMQTSVPNIYAIGDCVPTPALAHIASKEGTIAVEHMKGQTPVGINYDHTPSCVYSDPPMAWSGLTEAQAKERGETVKVSRFDFLRNGKAGILGKKRGFVKFVCDAKYGEILGVHIVGPQATELLAEPAFAMQMEATVDDIAHTIHAHPTLYESIFEAASIAADRAVHG